MANFELSMNMKECYYNLPSDGVVELSVFTLSAKITVLEQDEGCGKTYSSGKQLSMSSDCMCTG